MLKGSKFNERASASAEAKQAHAGKIPIAAVSR